MRPAAVVMYGCGDGGEGTMQVPSPNGKRAAGSRHGTSACGRDWVSAAQPLGGVAKDDRGIKVKTQKRSVNSIDKWQASEIWNEIVVEGEERITDMMEAIHLLHIPNTTPTEAKEPEPPPG